MLNYLIFSSSFYRLDEVGCSDCISIVSNVSVYVCSFADKTTKPSCNPLRKTSFAFVCAKTMEFSISLFRFIFIFSNRCYHRFYWEIVIIVSFGFGCIYGRMKWTEEKRTSNDRQIEDMHKNGRKKRDGISSSAIINYTSTTNERTTRLSTSRHINFD